MNDERQLEEAATSYKYPHVVEAAIDYEVGKQSSNWRLADALYEDIGDHESVSGQRSTSLRAEPLWMKLEEAYLEAKRAGARELKAKTLDHAYRTAVQWPPQDRVPSASFTAHKNLNDRPDRVKRLNQLLARSSDGWVSERDVRNWKRDQDPQVMVPFLEQVEQAIRQGVNRKVADWSRLGDEDRAAIVKILNRVTNEVAAGTFGRDL